jgi:hypothetical protein
VHFLKQQSPDLKLAFVTMNGVEFFQLLKFNFLYFFLNSVPDVYQIGSESHSGQWTRTRNPDQDLDPRREMALEKGNKILNLKCFKELDVLSGVLKAFPGV